LLFLSACEVAMERWLDAALDYLPQWLEYQMRVMEQPGCALAVAHKGRVVLECAFGHANVKTGERLTPRHRFRAASHSKSFTAAGILRLREQGRLSLDDRAGKYVTGLHPAIAQATLTQLLTHSAGVVRDGPDNGQFSDRRPYLSEAELRADLSRPAAIEPNTRFKYSNHGYGLLGLVVEAVTGEPYRRWIAREVVEAAGLEETQPDAPLRRGTPFAKGHTSRSLLGRRLVIPADNRTNAMAPATGFIATAGDLTRYFSQLSPGSSRSILSVASRRELVRRQWRNPHASVEGWYGLGIMSGSLMGWDHFGHAGGFQGVLTRSAAFPAQHLALSVLTNAGDGFAQAWFDGAALILRKFAEHGPAGRAQRAWAGRWWSLWGATDLVPMGGRVLVANPALFNPFHEASELTVRGDGGRIAVAAGYASHGEPARLERDGRGTVREVWLGGARFVSEKRMAREVARRYEP
jgi:D-alanyl-D-alanine carboxypeptidase